MKRFTNWKRAVVPFLLSFGLMLVVGQVNCLSYGWSSIIVSICFIMFTYIMLDKCRPEDFWTVFWGILLGRIWFEIPLRIVFFKDSLCSLMLSLFQTGNIVMTAWYYKRTKKAVMALWIVAWVVFLFWGHMAWQEFVFGREETFYDMYIKEIFNRD